MEKTMEHLKKVIISKRAELAAKGGHPWIYGTEIEHADEGIEAGDIVRVESKKGKFVGSGFYNPHSKITVRIFSTSSKMVMLCTSALTYKNSDRITMRSFCIYKRKKQCRIN